jgi:hypothetical protein
MPSITDIERASRQVRVVPFGDIVLVYMPPVPAGYLSDSPGTFVPVEEPSTASIADIVLARNYWAGAVVWMSQPTHARELSYDPRARHSSATNPAIAFARSSCAPGA